jgi:hypothetical protein
MRLVPLKTFTDPAEANRDLSKEQTARSNMEGQQTPRLKLSACLLMLSLSTSGFAQLKPAPLGSMVLLPVEDPHIATEPCWNDPNVQGVLLRDRWELVQPAAADSPHWDYFNNGVKVAQAKGKWVMLSVDCGLGGPSWVLSERGVGVWISYSVHGKMVENWSSAAQAYLKPVIRTLGQTFDSNSTVRGVTIWVGGTGIECYFAQNDKEVSEIKNDGGISVWLTGAETLVGYYQEFFPTTQLYLATGTANIDNRLTMTTLAQYCLSLGIGLQSNGASAGYPKGPDFPHTNLALTSIPLLGYQDSAPAAELHESLSSIEQNVLNVGLGKFWQVYLDDPSQPGGDAALAAFNAAVGAP